MNQSLSARFERAVQQVAEKSDRRKAKIAEKLGRVMEQAKTRQSREQKNAARKLYTRQRTARFREASRYHGPEPQIVTHYIEGKAYDVKLYPLVIREDDVRSVPHYGQRWRNPC